MESIDTRKQALEQWLIYVGLPVISIKAMVNDASFRRYFRIYTATDSFVAMDSPPPQENCQPFVAIAKTMRSVGLHAPEIINANIEQGFLLMTDFGEITYLNALNAQNANELYDRALKSLAILQRIKVVENRVIPPFTQEFMWQEWAWHKEWVFGKLLGLSLSAKEKDLDQCMALIIKSAADQPQVFMHRDFHSANLMVLAEGNVGILDFQDAFMGPITYDLVSLLRDCYIDWPPSSVLHWATSYWQMLQELNILTDTSPEEFLRWFDWMGIQRHLKALFTFTRKHLRDHQSYYLKYVPRTLSYLLSVTQAYPSFAPLHDYLNETVQPAFNQVQSLCVA